MTGTAEAPLVLRSDGGSNNESESGIEKLFDDCGRMMMALTRLRQPVIAKVRG